MDFLRIGGYRLEHGTVVGYPQAGYAWFGQKLIGAEEKRANVSDFILARTHLRTLTGATEWSDQIHVPIFATRTVISIPSDPAARFRHGHG